jgi:hypothetical protein
MCKIRFFLKGTNAVLCSEQWTGTIARNIFRSEGGNMVLTPTFEFTYRERFKTDFISVCLSVSI